jgi:hypothetical protein
MADILADLEGFLGPEAVAKVRTNPTLAARLQRGESIREYYDGNMDGDPPPPAARTQDPPPVVRAAAGTESLADVMGELSKVTERLGKIDEVVATKVDEVVKTRGNELVNSAVAVSMRNIRELSKVDARHRADFGAELDDSKLEAHVAAAQAAGRPFRSVTEAYDDMTREDRVKKEVAAGIATGVREELKTRSNASLPGVSAPGASPMLRQLHKVRSGTGTAGEQSAVSSAARALEERLAARGELVA